jgi:anti-sigma factor RsiW
MTAHLGPAATAFVDGQLDHRRRDEVLAHLLHCAQCRADVRGVRALKQSLRVAEPAVPSDLSLRLLAAAQVPAPAGVPRQRPRGHRRIRRTAVGGALVVMGVGATLSLAGPPPAGPPAKVDPSSVRFVIEHATTAGEVPFSEPELVPVSSANLLP